VPAPNHWHQPNVQDITHSCDGIRLGGIISSDASAQSGSTKFRTPEEFGWRDYNQLVNYVVARATARRLGISGRSVC